MKSLARASATTPAVSNASIGAHRRKPAAEHELPLGVAPLASCIVHVRVRAEATRPQLVHGMTSRRLKPLASRIAHVRDGATRPQLAHDADVKPLASHIFHGADATAGALSVAATCPRPPLAARRHHDARDGLGGPGATNGSPCARAVQPYAV